MSITYLEAIREAQARALALAAPTGLAKVARHRLIYDALGPLAAAGVHALRIEAKAPGES